MSRLLYLVRHTSVLPLDGVAPQEWRPTEEGLAAARRLAEAPAWLDIELVATSPEPKAVATAGPIAATAGLPLREEDDLREVHRGASPLATEAHQQRVREYLAGAATPGWEAKDDARHRIDRCLQRLLEKTRGPLAVVSHGTILSLYLGLFYDEWAAIPLPAVAVARDRVLLQPFRDVDAFLAASRG